jgi:biopolymer transport protein ExbD
MSELENSAGKPNLTPILDMVFQLITFFMLVINFKSASMDLSLKLPVVGTAAPVKGVQDLLILNIDKEGNLNVYGQAKKDIEGYIQAEAHASMIHSKLQAGDDLLTTVVVRADRATPFKLLNRVVKACQDSGFRKFALKAMNKAEEAK